jgi:hypothetical protein
MKIGCQYMRAGYSLFSEEFAIKPAISRNGGNGRSGSTFPSLISAFSVFSVAMTTHQDQGNAYCGLPAVWGGRTTA